MKEIPQFRIVGNATEDQKNEEREYLRNALYHHYQTALSEEDLEIIEKEEREKTKMELLLIDYANKETSSLMESVGAPSYDIPAENFHLLPPERYNQEERGESIATTYVRLQGSLMNDEYFKDCPVGFAKTVFHEMLHLKGRVSVEIEESDEKIHKTVYRHGLSANSAQKKNEVGDGHEHFRGLHEAVVADCEAKFMEKLLGLPLFSKERKRLDSQEVKDRIKELAKINKIPASDIFWVGENGERFVRVYYPKQREVFNYVCQEINKQCSQECPSVDDVKEEFLRSQFTGKLLPIARMVEKTFGKGSFRRLGDMTDDDNSAVQTLEALKGFRQRKLSEQS